MVAHIFNPSTQEAEAGGSLWVRGQPGLYNEFQDNQKYIVNPVSKQTDRQTNNKNNETATVNELLKEGSNQESYQAVTSGSHNSEQRGTVTPRVQQCHTWFSINSLLIGLKTHLTRGKITSGPGNLSSCLGLLKSWILEENPEPPLYQTSIGTNYILSLCPYSHRQIQSWLLIKEMSLYNIWR